MTTPRVHVVTEASQICVSIIGMAGCGKSTVGRALATYLDWAHVDTDHLIESTYAAHLHQLTDALAREEFLHIEDEIVRALRLRRAVISTGGSVIYSEGAMRHLASLGPVVHLNLALPVILERIARNPERGLVIAPGQTVESLFAERESLYSAWRSHTVETPGNEAPATVARRIAELLGLEPGVSAPSAAYPLQEKRHDRHS